MKSVKNTYQLNPEIKEQAEKLFKLIEEEVENVGDDNIACGIAEQWGEHLKSSKGFDILTYAHTLAQTESERAVMCLEQAADHMEDKALEMITGLYENALKVDEIWDNKSNMDVRSLDFRIKETGKAAKKIQQKLQGFWRYRGLNYREELEELKKGRLTNA